jgi:hypothetical protein
MELTKGMIRDVHPSKFPDGGWTDAVNMVASTRLRAITNEDGFLRIDGVYASIVGCIEIGNRLVLFLALPLQDCAIVILEEDDTLTTVIFDTVLDFNSNNPIEGVFTYNYKRELIIAWWETLDNFANPPRTLNLDCLPFEVDVDKALVDPTQIYLAKLFPDVGAAQINLVRVLDTGGQVRSGVYSFMYAYQLSDGTITNYSGITNWIPVNDDPSTNLFTNIDGCPADSITSKAITVRISNIDINYPNLVIAIIKKIGGVISVVRTEAIPVVNNSVEFTYVNDDTLLDESLGNIIVPTTAYSHIKTGAVLNNRLYIANMRTIPEFDFQPYANNIKLKWNRATAVNLAAYAGSYKDPVFIVDKRSFLTGEVYAFYIIFKMKDGTYSSAYHIPARAVENMAGFGNLPENSRIQDMVTAGFPPPNSAEFIAIDNNARYHEVYPTAKSTGELGVFENQNELYADNDCWDIKDAAGIVIGNLRNQKVRHHRMPSIDQLQVWGNPFYTKSTGASNTDLLTVIGNGWGGNSNYDFTNTFIDAVYFTATTTTDKHEVTAVIDFEGYFSGNFTWSTSPINFVIRIDIVRISGGIETLLNEAVNGYIFGPAGEKTFNYYVVLEVGDIIRTNIEITGSPLITRPEFANVFFRFNKDFFAESDGSSKILAITMHDVNIPQEIKDNIEGYQLCYAQRTPSNSIKVANGLMLNSRFDTTKKEYLLESFDLVNNRPPITPAFIKTLIKFNIGTFNVYKNLLFETYTADTIYRKIEKSLYLAANVTLPEKNMGSDSTYFVALNNAISYAANDVYYSELHNYVKDVYRNFSAQRLVLIPTLIDKVIVNTGVIYGGDTFINTYGHYVYKRGSNGEYLTVVESNANIGYRHDDEINDLMYLPKKFPAINPEPYFGEYIGYNDDYTSINNLLSLVVYRCADACDTKVSDFPYRIHRSAVVGEEAFEFGWRKFAPNEYREMPDRSKGEIWKIIAFNKAMIIYQKYSMFLAQFRDTLYTNDVETYLGTGDIFAREPDEILPDGRGYAGNQSQYCTFLCKHGVVHIDAEQGKVFLFNGKLEELSAKGMLSWFTEFFRKDSTIDNPFLSSGYHGTFIEESNRIVLTKNGARAETISYSFNLDAWVSRHTYRGQMYASTRNGSYCYADGFLYKMEAGIVGMFDRVNLEFEQQREEAYIDVVFAEPHDIAKVIQSVLWDTKVYSKVGTSYKPVLLYDKTINRIVIYNDAQVSGEITLVNGKNLINLYDTVRNVEYNWKFNDFRDAVIDRNQPILFEDGKLNTANINLLKVWFKKSKFISKFVIVRMIIDNIDELTIDIENVNVNLKKSER